MNTQIKVVDFIGQAATRALLNEVSATPKPGLVDRLNNGAHKDMNFFTFISSMEAIEPYFFEMAELGFGWNDTLDSLFLKLREVGVRAEEAMFQATENVNTHKGLIFSLGIICGAAAYYYKKYGTFNADEILLLCKEMTKNIIEDEFNAIKERMPKTNGEKLYLKYNVKGIRGEAQSGFESVRNISMPIMRDLLSQQKNSTLNDLSVQVLLYLMKEVEDTNVLSRHDFQTLKYVQFTAKEALQKNGNFTEEGREFLKKMDEEFIKYNISPGGCADLLAITLMMHEIEEYDEQSALDKNDISMIK